MKGVPIHHIEYKRFLTEREAATYAGMTIMEFRRECRITPHERSKGRKVYDVSELDVWLDTGKKPLINQDEILARLS